MSMSQILIGTNFADDLRAAGLGDLPVSWDSSGLLQFADTVSEENRQAIAEVLEAHIPDAGKK